MKAMDQTEKATSWQVGLAAGWPQGRGKWARRASRSEVKGKILACSPREPTCCDFAAFLPQALVPQCGLLSSRTSSQRIHPTGDQRHARVVHFRAGNRWHLIRITSIHARDQNGTRGTARCNDICISDTDSGGLRHDPACIGRRECCRISQIEIYRRAAVRPMTLRTIGMQIGTCALIECTRRSIRVWQ